MANVNHASLCSTAMTGAALEAFRRVCAEHDTYIDVQLWKSAVTKIIHKPSPRGVVGRKGLPGRPGIGVGHRL